jgi:hypothetical protein
MIAPMIGIFLYAFLATLFLAIALIKLQRQRTLSELRGAMLMPDEILIERIAHRALDSANSPRKGGVNPPPSTPKPQIKPGRKMNKKQEENWSIMVVDLTEKAPQNSGEAVPVHGRNEGTESFCVTKKWDSKRGIWVDSTTDTTIIKTNIEKEIANVRSELAKVQRCLETEKYYHGFYKSRIKLLEETLESLKKKEDVETK